MDCQSGFILSYSCVTQIVSTTHEIYKSFDCKAFEKVWHKGLISKLKSYGVNGIFLKLIENYLKGRQQRVVLNSQISSWKNIPARVSQGSVLGLHLVLIYINDLTNGIELICNITFFQKLRTKIFSMLNLITIWIK